MFDFLKKKKVKKLTIKCNSESIIINDQPISFPTDYSTLTKVLGKPTREIKKSNIYLFWDDYGVFYGSNNLDKVLSINFYQNKKDKSEYNTKNQLLIVGVQFTTEH